MCTGFTTGVHHGQSHCHDKPQTRSLHVARQPPLPPPTPNAAACQLLRPHSPSPPRMQVGTQRRVQPSICFLLLPSIRLLSRGPCCSPANHTHGCAWVQGARCEVLSANACVDMRSCVRQLEKGGRARKTGRKAKTTAPPQRRDAATTAVKQAYSACLLSAMPSCG